ncbi:MAG: 23S rRNA (adenine(2503)-C(2))-methyltransferase RlmN, partial [Proteobacteria bacterium]|nr:23S rRNA (adenine(2503)-C(2))-methyltransferase RlmN [Pseudomonadota bacterium]
MKKVDLKDLDLNETKAHVEKIGLETYKAEQIRQWIFGHKATSFEAMTNISKELRSYLS